MLIFTKNHVRYVYKHYAYKKKNMHFLGVFFGYFAVLLPIIFFSIKILLIYMIKTKVAFLEGRLLSSQSEQSEKFYST